MILATHGIISSYVGVDTDAQAFITATGITDTTQKSAINKLVLDLKSYSIWTKFKAIYPFVGGNATTHKFNLKDPRDLDAAFRLQFVNGWTHSSTGASPNGTDAYANTFFRAGTVLGHNFNAHISKYNRTNDLTGNKIDGVYGSAGGSIQYIQQNYSSANGAIGDVNSVVSYTQTDTRGLFTTTRTSATSVKVFKDSTQQGTTNTFNSSYLPDDNVYIGCRNDAGNPFFFNSYEAAFFSLGNGLTDTDVSNLYTSVNNYQVALSRNV